MSEEIVNTEKFIIRMLEHSIDTYIEGTKVTKVELTTEQAQVLLDLYNKQKEEIQSLENQLDFIGEQNKYIDRLEYLIKKKDAYIEELENWTKEHPSVIAMPKEIREEAEKLGHFADLVTIEEKEYISKDKIKEKIEEEEEHLSFENTEMEDHTIAILNELLEGR